MKIISTDLTDQEKNEIQLFISDYITLIFKSVPLIEIQKTNLSNLFKTKFGRFYFSTIVFQEKFKNVIY